LGNQRLQAQDGPRVQVAHRGQQPVAQEGVHAFALGGILQVQGVKQKISALRAVLSGAQPPACEPDSRCAHQGQPEVSSLHGKFAI
jgi:hypothetical protein